MECCHAQYQCAEGRILFVVMMNVVMMSVVAPSWQLFSRQKLFAITEDKFDDNDTCSVRISSSNLLVFRMAAIWNRKWTTIS